jgi:hypothetical protein
VPPVVPIKAIKLLDTSLTSYVWIKIKLESHFPPQTLLPVRPVYAFPGRRDWLCFVKGFKLLDISLPLNVCYKKCHTPILPTQTLTPVLPVDASPGSWDCQCFIKGFKLLNISLPYSHGLFHMFFFLNTLVLLCEIRVMDYVYVDADVCWGENDKGDHIVGEQDGAHNLVRITGLEFSRLGHKDIQLSDGLWVVKLEELIYSTTDMAAEGRWWLLVMVTHIDSESYCSYGTLYLLSPNKSRLINLLSVFRHIKWNPAPSFGLIKPLRRSWYSQRLGKPHTGATGGTN